MYTFTRFASRLLLGPLLFAFAILAHAQAPQEGALSETLFRQPPAASGIRCWWWWLNGNVTRASITRDLEEMKAKGFSGACIFDAGGHTQGGNGPVPEGPMFGSPAWRALYVHAVDEAERLGLVLSLSIQSGWNLGGPDVRPEESTKQLVWSETRVSGSRQLSRSLPQPETRQGFYRDIAVIAYPVRKKPAAAPIRQLALKAGFREAGGSSPDMRPLLTDVAPTPGEEEALLSQVLDLSRHTTGAGQLNWQVPAGDWVILRFGYTASGAHVSTSSGKWQGLVIDYLSRKHFNRYWDTHVEPLLLAIGPRAGKTLRYLQTDSWEAGGINWTDDFAAEFRRRRGYDLLPYLPVVAGRIIQDRETSNRFLADFRKTIGDCMADNHYCTFAERARRHGLGIQPESAGPHAGPFDGLKNFGHSEIMMGEFWSPSPHRPKPENRFFVKQAASAAHIYGQRLVGAEAFTTIGPHWNDVIWSDMKPSADHEFCSGLNLVFLHTFTASPKEMGLPGQEYFAGTHFNPNVTWWNLSGAFTQYLARCQYLLQQGRFAADVLYYYGDHIPNIARRKADDPAKVLPGFDYDVINEDRLLALTVEQGRLRLPTGMSYRLLALPDHGVLSLAALQQVEKLVRAGATVLGPRPQTTASLVSYPGSEEELRRVAAALWGTDNSATGSRQVGAGRVIWGRTARQVLLADQVPADFEARGGKPGQVFDYIHHRLGEADYYFVSSQNREASQAACTFRVAGRQPELWDPVTGQVRPLPAFEQEAGRTRLSLALAPYGSAFIVFRKPAPSPASPSGLANFPVFTPLAAISGAWELRFDPEWGGPAAVTFDSLSSWHLRPEEGIRYYSGSVLYRKTFHSPKHKKGEELYLDLGQVQDVGVARVVLNGQNLGTLWAPPYRVAVGGLLKKKGNKLEIEVVNSWRNRLVGDRGKPREQRFTQTNITIRPEWQLLPAGLLGPVQVLRASPGR